MTWIKIKDYENYEINELGHVRRNGKIRKSFISNNGYLIIQLCKDGKIKHFLIHRLIAQTFVKNPENKQYVNHIDGNRQNNLIENLEWVTKSENILHAYHITKNRIISPPMKGKFGKNHNRSKSFHIEFPSGKFIEYGSGLEFQRCTGFSRRIISYVRNFGRSHYFLKGKMKGLTVYFNAEDVKNVV